MKAGEGNRTFVMEVLGWVIDTEAGTLALPDSKLQEMNQLFATLATQRCISQKELERLVENIRLMHLAVPGAVAHLCNIQHALAQGG